MNHGVDAVTLIVGIVRGGYGYTPLDPNIPAARLAQMLELAGSNQIVTDRANEDLARQVAGDQLKVLVFEAIGDTTSDPGDAPSSGRGGRGG